MNTLTAGADIPGSESPTIIFRDGLSVGFAGAPCMSKDEAVAMARLWAAAPELLAACEEASKAIGTLPSLFLYEHEHGQRLACVSTLKHMLESVVAKGRGTT